MSLSNAFFDTTFRREILQAFCGKRGTCPGYQVLPLRFLLVLRLLVRKGSAVTPGDLPDIRVIVTLSVILASRILVNNDRTEVNPFLFYK